jgi:hypothetical protein
MVICVNRIGMGVGASKSRKAHPTVTQTRRKVKNPLKADSSSSLLSSAKSIASPPNTNNQKQKRIDKLIEKLKEFGKDKGLEDEVNHYIRMADKFKNVDSLLRYVEAKKNVLKKKLNEDDEFNREIWKNAAGQLRIEKRKGIRERIDLVDDYFKEQARSIDDDNDDTLLDEFKGLFIKSEKKSNSKNLTDDEDAWLDDFIKHYKTLAKK